MLACHAGLSLGIFEQAAELPLLQSVNQLSWLFFTELRAVIGQPPAALTVLAWRITPSLDRALFGHTACALQKQLHAFSSAQPTHWTTILSHCVLPLYRDRSSHSPSAITHCDDASTMNSAYTLRRFGGLHPLCGMGVTSRMRLILRPALCNDRMADSRPDPGPLT